MRMAGLRDRTKQFALRIIRLSAALPKSNEAQVIWEVATALRHKRGGELSRSVKSTIRC